MKLQSKMMLWLCLPVLFLMACNEPAEKEVDKESVKAEIQAMEDAFAAAEKNNDVDAVAAYYAEDAVSYNRNEPPSQGMAAIKEKIARNLAKDSTGDYNVYKVVDLFVEGNKATEIGSWTNYNAAGEEKENGYYMSYFEKRDGKYKCVRDMSVTTNPVKSSL